MNTTMNTGAASLSDEQILEHFEMPGLNLEATLDAHDIGLLLTGIRTLLATPTPQADAAPIINGHAINDLFLKWSEWTTELGEAISRKNIDGFVSQLRAAIAAGGAQEADDAEISEHLIKRMSNLLAGVAIALKGAEEAMTRHGYQDLPELAAKLMCEVELHRAREAEMTDHDRTACNNVYQMMTEGCAAPLPREAATVALTDERIVSIWEGMPDGASGFRKSWGYLQFARALLAASNGEQA
jgi:hypothetical protein